MMTLTLHGNGVDVRVRVHAGAGEHQRPLCDVLCVVEPVGEIQEVNQYHDQKLIESVSKGSISGTAHPA